MSGMPHRSPPGPLDVLVLGEVNPDLVLRGDVVPRFGQSEQLLDSVDIEIGGSGAITAHALARLGLSVRLLAEVGDDDFGARMRDRLYAAGVDVTGVLVSGQPTGVSVVLSDGDARATLTFPGAVDAPAPPWDSPDDIPAARHLHIASYFLQQQRAAALPRLLPLVRARGMSVSLDTNLDPAGRFAGLAEVLPLVDVFLPNAAEALAAARAVTGEEVATLDEAASRLAAYGPTVVIKDGKRGALSCHRGELIREAGVALEAVDTTGAGDSFDAAYLAAMLEGRPEATRLRWACAAGAAATQHVGGTGGQVSRAELLSRLGSGA